MAELVGPKVNLRMHCSPTLVKDGFNLDVISLFSSRLFFPDPQVKSIPDNEIAADEFPFA